MGDPIPLARPRFYASKGLSSRTHVYDAQKKAKTTSIAEIQRQFELHHSPNCVLDGVALRLDVRFTLATPKSQKMQYSKLHGKPHIIRPDTSNMIKYIEDVCSGLIYRDDALISKILAYKRYGLESYTEFKVSVMSQYEIDQMNIENDMYRFVKDLEEYVDPKPRFDTPDRIYE